jgi:hypothetical protein
MEGSFSIHAVIDNCRLIKRSAIIQKQIVNLFHKVRVIDSTPVEPDSNGANGNSAENMNNSYGSNKKSSSVQYK